MKLSNLKKITSAAVFGAVMLIGTAEIVNAQTYRDRVRQQRQYERQQQRQYNKQQRQYARRQQRAINRQYRIYRNGRYYSTDNRGVELLRRAVNSGYQQGYRAGQSDNGYRRGYNYRNQSVYRRGNYGYQRYVDSNQYRYYFQQGFERGYKDGYYSRNQYGYRSNGGLNILGSILSGILNIQSY